jgi:hypothetical protein
MKKSELRQIIRKAINEVVNEAEITPQEKAAKDAELNSINKQITALNAKKSDLSSGRTSVVSEDKLDELANVALRYELAPDVDPGKFTGKKNRIVSKMKEIDEPISKIDLAYELGYNKQQPVNSDFMELVARGVIVAAEEQKAPRAAADDFTPIKPVTIKKRDIGGFGDVPSDVADDEEDDEEEETSDEFDFIVGDMSDEEVDAMFAKMKQSGEEEPIVSKTSDLGIPDEDYQNFMKVSDLEARLNKVKSDIFKARRSKNVAGDFKDKPSSELQRLIDLKASLEQRINDLIAGSEYLQKRQAKANQAKEKPEEPIDEWFMEQLKYRAGIIK